MKRIAIVTGSRAEFGLLLPVIRAIESTPELDVAVIATGVHLLEEYGHTVEEVRAACGDRVHEVSFYPDGDIDDGSLPAAIGAGTAHIGAALVTLGADIVLVLGDRAEALAAALAGYAGNRVVAHIHGGDRTSSGHVDEGFRHAITRIAHLHFAASAESERRLLDSGEEPWRVHRSGSPGIDTAMEVARNPDPAVRARYGLPAEGPFALFLFHPDRIDRDDAGVTARIVLEELRQRALPTLALYPNSDPGSADVIAAIRAAEGAGDLVHVRESIPRSDFLALQGQAALFIGNSSAGVIESSCFGVPVVNVGERNRDREHGDNVIFVGVEQGEIAEGIERALHDETFLARARAGECPHGNGKAAETIARVLREIDLEEALYRKQLVL